ncbi:MAG: 16S rRNA (guanine(966)-N(2))-methyltransferase RsmD [Paracoccaceae bacterium]
MRVIAGEWRGRRLTPVGKGDAGAHLRPTPDRVRESLFSALSARSALSGARVLDLFAGTGALGFEAVSRGADCAVFIENGRVGQKLIASNISLLNAQDRCHLAKKDATRLGPCAVDPFELVFLDPPYGQNLGALALSSALESGWISTDSLIVWEEEAPMPPPVGFRSVDQRRYGTTHITFLEPNQS